MIKQILLLSLITFSCTKEPETYPFTFGTAIKVVNGFYKGCIGFAGDAKNTKVTAVVLVNCPNFTDFQRQVEIIENSNLEILP